MVTAANHQVSAKATVKVVSPGAADQMILAAVAVKKVPARLTTKQVFCAVAGQRVGLVVADPVDRIISGESERFNILG
jgi:hypothetical protein